MLHFGYISEVDQATGLYRVSLQDLNIVTPWLSAINQDTKDTKDENTMVVNQHVALSMKKSLSEGVIIGAVYDRKNPPAVQDKNKRVTTYADGSVVSFDKSDGKYSAHYTGELRLESDDITKIYGNPEVWLNGNANGGIPKVVPLVSKIAALQTAENAFKTIISAILAAGTGSPGTPVTNATLAAYFTTYNVVPIVVTTVPDLENPNAQH
jgi:phage baseplate assembly protein V